MRLVPSHTWIRAVICAYIARFTAVAAASAVLGLTLLLAAPLYAEDDAVYRAFTDAPKFSNDRFSLEPSYFIFGVPNTKFQLAFIYQFSSRADFYFGYSQLVVWDLNGYQAPLRDINCHPYLYYKFNLDYGIVRSVDLGVWEHNSNLKGGSPDHRGWDRSYIKINTYASFGNLGVMMNFKFFALYRLDRNNRGIDNYMGFWEISGLASYYADLYLFDQVDLSVKLYAGSRYGYLLHKGALELGVSFKISGNPAHVYFQYYNGYNEYLLEYRMHHVAIRYGFLVYL